MKKIMSLCAIGFALAGLASVEVSAQTSFVWATSSNAKMAEFRSESDIRSYLAAHPFDVTKADTWNIRPDYKNNIAGELSDASRQNALNTLNVMRYIAGLEEVSYDINTEKYAQASSTLMVGIGGITHHPERKSGVSDELYNLGSHGASHSNLATGYDTLSEAIIYGWMNDGSPNNIASVGHRRWALSPGLEKTSFGIAIAPDTIEYTSMYCIYTGTDLWNSFFGTPSGSGPSVDFLTWPAATMPVEYMYGPWSISLNSDYYIANKNDVNVTLTNLNTNKSYFFDKNDNSYTGEFFNVSYENIGTLNYNIVFDAKLKFNAGDKYKVRIEGLKDRSGNTYNPIEYTVDFFSLYGGKQFGRPGLEVKKDGSIVVHTSSKGKSGGGSGGSGGGSGKSGGSGGSGGGSAKARFTWGFLDTTNNSSTNGRWFELSSGGWGYYLNNEIVNNNWVKDNGHWFYINDNSKLVENSWLKVNNSWFYAKGGGYIAENEWLFSNNKWYYAQAGGYIAANQWLLLNGKWYCFDSNCALYVNTTTPDGYRVDQNGAWIQ